MSSKALARENSVTKSVEKHNLFISEKMGSKDISTLPGISEVLRRRFQEVGMTKAYHILGKFLTFDKDHEKFAYWICDEVSANNTQADECFNCLKEWCDSYL